METHKKVLLFWHNTFRSQLFEAFQAFQIRHSTYFTQKSSKRRNETDIYIYIYIYCVSAWQMETVRATDRQGDKDRFRERKTKKERKKERIRLWWPSSLRPWDYLSTDSKGPWSQVWIPLGALIYMVANPPNVYSQYYNMDLPNVR